MNAELYRYILLMLLVFPYLVAGYYLGLKDIPDCVETRILGIVYQSWMMVWVTFEFFFWAPFVLEPPSFAVLLAWSASYTAGAILFWITMPPYFCQDEPLWQFGLAYFIACILRLLCLWMAKVNRL